MGATMRAPQTPAWTQGLAGAERGETPEHAAGVRGGDPREPCVRCGTGLGLGLALVAGRAPAGCGGAAGRRGRLLPTFLAKEALGAGVARTPLRNVGGSGGRGKRIYGKTSAQEVCRKRAQLMDGCKFYFSGKACGSTHTTPPTHRHTRREGVKFAAGELPLL